MTAPKTAMAAASVNKNQSVLPALDILCLRTFYASSQLSDFRLKHGASFLKALEHVKTRACRRKQNTVAMFGRPKRFANRIAKRIREFYFRKLRQLRVDIFSVFADHNDLPNRSLN